MVRELLFDGTVSVCQILTKRWYLKLIVLECMWRKWAVITFFEAVYQFHGTSVPPFPEVFLVRLVSFLKIDFVLLLARFFPIFGVCLLC